MTRTLLSRGLPALAFAALLSAPGRVEAQAAPDPDAFTLGSWTFRPLVEVRVRGEYRRHPFDTGGDSYAETAVLGDGYKSTVPTVSATRAAVGNQFLIEERSRLGLGVDRGPVSAQITLQDARLWGDPSGAIVGSGQPALPAFAPYEAYLDVHTQSGRKVFLRVGRQAFQIGDGWLVGKNDWSATGRSLDAARFGFQAGDFDVQLFAAMLAPPGALPPSATGTATTASEGIGAQLYGLDVTFRLFPWLSFEATGLARVARPPLPISLTPSDVVVIDGRIFGDRRGFRYAIEGAYELGRVSAVGTNRKLSAFAGNATLSWETALPGHLTFGAEGAYASGDDGTTKGNVTRFDPILPDEHTHLGAMSLVAWSNVATVGGSVSAKPIEELGLSAGYHYVALANAAGRWTSAELQPIGAAPTNVARSLGHEIDAAIKLTPWSPVSFETGYGAFIRGSGADAILQAASRPATLQHWVYLQATVRAP